MKSKPAGWYSRAAQLLQMELGSRELIEYTQVIIHEADRLQTLVDRLLVPTAAPMWWAMSISTRCERVRSVILAEYPKGLKIIRDYDASLPDFRGDREQLIQAVMNIAQNAASRRFPPEWPKAMPA